MMLGSSVPFDLDRIPSDYIFVIISKKGIPFKDINKQFAPNENFYTNEGLDYRVWQGDEVIKDITKTIIKKPSKIVIIGHSEGSTVVAKLGHINKKVTHIGYWAGGANTQYYDFALMIQKKVQQGEINQDDAINQLDSLFLAVKNIQKEPNNINKEWWGNSYRRWSQFALPSIDNLLKVKKPIFVAVGTLDENVPFEASLLIPIEFARYNKTNLTFKMYEGYNHSFYKKPEKEGDYWNNEFMSVFDEFIKWVEN
jgi:esterase/lipase